MELKKMELVHERALELQDKHGQTFRRVLIFAERQPAGTWAAWVEFVSATGEAVVRTDRETTQSTTLAGIAHWATRLPRTYFEGALDRASRRTDPRPRPPPDAPATGAGMVSFRIRSADPRVMFRVMAAPTVIPGHRRPVADDGAFIYVRTVEPALREMPRIYEFLAHFPSSSAAAVLATRLEADLRGTGATLEIRRADVPVESAAILTALLTAAAGGSEFTGRR